MRDLVLRGSVMLMLILGSVVHPQPAQADEAAKQKLFIELYEVMQYGRILDQMSRQMGQQVETMLRHKFGEVDPKALQAIAEVLQEVLTELSPEIVRFSGEFMVKNFTEEEIAAIIAFYKTPAGQKSLQVLPKMTTEMTTWLVPRIQQLRRDMVARMNKRLKALGYTL